MTAPISVLGMYEDRTGTLWLASESDVFRWSAQTATLVRSPPPFQSLGASSDVVNRSIWVTSGHTSFRMHDRVLRDRQGDVWFGTHGDGLLHVRGPLASHGPMVEQFTHLAGLTSERVLSLLEDRDGNIWIGTESGLLCLPLSLSTQLERRPDLGRRAVHVVVATRDGSVWTGTADGLNQSIRDGSRWYFRRDGLPGDVINALHEDAQGPCGWRPTRAWPVSRTDVSPPSRLLDRPGRNGSSRSRRTRVDSGCANTKGCAGSRTAC
jgi:ligand-binding sensor domain-containing protein